MSKGDYNEKTCINLIIFQWNNKKIKYMSQQVKLELLDWLVVIKKICYTFYYLIIGFFLRGTVVCCQEVLLWHPDCLSRITHLFQPPLLSQICYLSQIPLLFKTPSYLVVRSGRWSIYLYLHIQNAYLYLCICIWKKKSETNLVNSDIVFL